MEGIQTRAGRRLAFISQCLGRIVPPRADGSIAIWTYETAKRLSQQQPVLLLELGEHPLRTVKAQHDGATYVYLPTGPNRLLNALHQRLAGLRRKWWAAERQVRQPVYASTFHNLGFILQAGWHARRWSAEVIHLHNFSQFAPVVRALNPTARILLHMNCEWLSQHEPRMIARRLETVDGVVACSGHVAGRLVGRFPRMAAKCHVVFNGGDVERFVPSPAPSAPAGNGDMHILFVGRISPEKGVHVLAEAFTRVAAEFPTARLDLVGGAGAMPADYLVALSDDPLVKGLAAFYHCDYLTEVKRRIPAALGDRVTFHGNVPHQELAAHYARACVFVIPSFSDAFPLTVVEAMAAGLPVVGSAVGGVPEEVVHEETGLLVKPDCPESLASAIRRLLRDRDLRVRMAMAGRQRAERLFSWQAVTDAVRRVHLGVAPPAAPL